MAIDDNTIYGLYGSQVKDLAQKVKDAGEGLTTLSYGSSTWNDFITAYNAGEIVYCRASSGSNPGVGSQTRMAFMAYVNDAANPTEVEFQYVRSVSTKSASNQSDQVFVYKLTNANGGTWTVETRPVMVKIAVGSNMTSSYSNNTLTLDATGGGSVTPVQTTGTSTTDVMSQNATSSMVYADPGTDTKIKIGAGAYASLGTDGVEIGHNAKAGSTYAIGIGSSAEAKGTESIALGYATEATNNGVCLGSHCKASAQNAVAFQYSRALSKGEVAFGMASWGTNGGYNNSNYRLLTGLYDPQNAHDAATKGYVDTATSGKADITYVDAQLDGKQDELTAGTGITITDESGALVISATATGPDTFTTNEWNALWA